jgi:hypothetical protein
MLQMLPTASSLSASTASASTPVRAASPQVDVAVHTAETPARTLTPTRRTATTTSTTTAAAAVAVAEQYGYVPARDSAPSETSARDTTGSGASSGSTDAAVSTSTDDDDYAELTRADVYGDALIKRGSGDAAITRVSDEQSDDDSADTEIASRAVRSGGTGRVRDAIAEPPPSVGVSHRSVAARAVKKKLRQTGESNG